MQSLKNVMLIVPTCRYCGEKKSTSQLWQLLSRLGLQIINLGHNFSFKCEKEKCCFCKYLILSPFDAFIHSKCFPIDYFGDGKIVQSCRVTRSENSAKVSCVICWSNRSGWNSRFLANLLDGNVLFVLEKRNVCPLLFTQSARKNHAWKMNFANVLDWPLQSSKTYQLIFLS